MTEHWNLNWDISIRAGSLFISTYRALLEKSSSVFFVLAIDGFRKFSYNISRYPDIIGKEKLRMQAIHLFKALADETRLRIVNLLNEKEYSVNDILSILGMGQSRISRHLKILSDSGILKFRRDGLWVFYTVSDLEETKKLLTFIQPMFEKEPVYLDDLKEAEKYRSESVKKSAEFFDSVAEDWDKLKKELFGSVDIGSIIIDRIPESAVCADLGCGNGALIDGMLLKSRLVIGVDNSPGMLKTARMKYADNPDVNFRIGEMEHLPLRDGEADTAVMNMVLHHLPQPHLGIQEAYRVMKPGAVFILCELDQHTDESMRQKYGDRWLGFTRGEVEKWILSSGFNLKTTESFSLNKGIKANLFIAGK